MNINVRKINSWFVVLLINIILIQYITKVYDIGLIGDSFRYAAISLLGSIIVIKIFTTFLKNKKITLILLLFLVYSIYITIMVLIHGNFELYLFMNSLFFPLIFLSSYYLNKTDSIFEGVVRLQYFVMIIIFGLYLYSKFILTYQNPLMINSIYYLVLLLPFIYSIRNLLFRNIGIVLILSAVFISMKRTAFLATVISLLVYLLLNKERSKNGVITKFLFITATIVMFTLLYDYIQGFGFDVFNRLASIQQDGGSNRFEIYNVVLWGLSQNSFLEFITGNGYNGVALLTGGISAHNDFLEILYDFGIIGLSLYMSIYIILIKYAINFKRAKYEYFGAFTASIYIFLIMSLSSHLIFIPTYVAFLALFWGSCIYHYEYNHIKIKNKI